jgi:hypothetical protein
MQWDELLQVGANFIMKLNGTGYRAGTEELQKSAS